MNKIFSNSIYWSVVQKVKLKNWSLVHDTIASFIPRSIFKYENWQINFETICLIWNIRELYSSVNQSKKKFEMLLTLLEFYMQSNLKSRVVCACLDRFIFHVHQSLMQNDFMSSIVHWFKQQRQNKLFLNSLIVLCSSWKMETIPTIHEFVFERIIW